MDRKTLELLKYHTLACWWPSAYNPLPAPDWAGISNELYAAAAAARTCRDGDKEAAELLALSDVAAAQEHKP